MYPSAPAPVARTLLLHAPAREARAPAPGPTPRPAHHARGSACPVPTRPRAAQLMNVLADDFGCPWVHFGKRLQIVLKSKPAGGGHFGELDAIAQCRIRGLYGSLCRNLSAPYPYANINDRSCWQWKQHFHVTATQADVRGFRGSGVGLPRRTQLNWDGTAVARKSPLLWEFVLHTFCVRLHDPRPLASACQKGAKRRPRLKDMWPTRATSVLKFRTGQWVTKHTGGQVPWEP